jgi:phenylacetate-CoA ligase
VNLYPSAVDAVVRQFPEVVEYQVLCQEKDSMTEVSMQAEASAETAQALEVALKEAFSLRIPVKRAEPNSLPRFEMKARRWVR